jgi:succinate dehydrogenase / fumarate reductase iron-sulfur subunit
MKERVVDRSFDPVVWLGSRIRRRDKRSEPDPPPPNAVV